ncbi:DUF1961 family protein [Catenovulum agarivorans]|uniref:DUF1961 family protein n=1 Tax=Catenovulum agarivorans TaxID=1172192 RepID=UPI0002D34C03|nr:DUF1961 family protein [Catenovulum agarivorans]
MKILSSALVTLLKASLVMLPISCSDVTTGQPQASEDEAEIFADIEPSKQSQFEQINNESWQQLMFDSGTKNWQQHWSIDGLVGTVENTPQGMHVSGGPEAKNHAHHLVVWSKQVFSGDIKLEFEYTRTDAAIRYVTIIYMLASGEGTPEFDKDIMAWADYRQQPYMRHYFDNMNTYHISYAAYGVENNDPEQDYVRARRYMPLANKGLKGTALEGDNMNTGFFATGVPHQITVIKNGHNLWMKVQNSEQSQVYYWDTSSHPYLNEGRIGLRHMFTRSAIYKDIRISSLAAD